MTEQLGEQVGEVAPSSVLLNVLAIPVSILTCAGCVVLAGLLTSDGFLEAIAKSGSWEMPRFLLLTGIYVVLHELLHGVGARRFGGLPWRVIKFGVMWRYCMPYCHYAGAMPLNGYRWVTLLPLLVIGPASLLLLAVFPFLSVAMAAGLHLAACIGDLWVFACLRKFPGDHWVVDYPDKIGAAVFAPAKPPSATT